MPENDAVRPLIQLDATSTAAARRDAIARIGNAQFTPVEGQVAFIKELIKSPAESQKFLRNPKQYAVDHGILLHPALVQKIVDQLIFDVALDEDFCGTVGPHVTKDLVDLRNKLKNPPGPRPIGPDGDPINPVANAAAVAAGAAVVMAVVAVVTMVVTLVRTKKPADLVSLQGLGQAGVVLPGGVRFTDRTGIRDVGRLPGLRGPALGGLR